MISGVWQGGSMTDLKPQTPPAPQAAGFLLILFILGGAGIGVWQRQPSVGLLSGAAVGTLIALALWWRDRARTGR
jgi:uncharacterized membrane protein (UPF0136 family)